MAGIVSFGAYIPFHRLERKKIAEAFGEPGGKGEKAVANHDEDSLSMAVAAAQDALTGWPANRLAAVYFATTTAPYVEKQSSTTIAAALDCQAQIRTADFTDSLRAGTTALLAGLETVQAQGAPVLVTAADCRLGGAQGSFEKELGDAAAAFILGDQDVIAELVASYSVAADFLDQWRSQGDRTIRSWEDRFVLSEGFFPQVKAAVSGLLSQAGCRPQDLAKVVLYAPNARAHATAAKAMGLAPEQVQDPLFDRVGNAGAASVPLMLAAALEEAQPGDRILVVSQGQGSDALLFQVTDAIRKLPARRGVKGHLASKKQIAHYTTYLKWKNMLPLEAGRRPQRQRPSVPAMWRNHEQNLAFVGSRCTACGTPQYPKQRVCVHCKAKDQMEDYPFSDKKARIATYTVDYLTVSPDPPTVFVVVDFEGGGRIICEMTDTDPAQLDIGMEVEMTFRRLYEAEGIHNYAWKARMKR